MKRPPGCTFRPADPPRAIWDHVLNSPGLLIGHWVQGNGLEYEAVVCTMTQTRHLSQVSSAEGRAPRPPGRTPMPPMPAMPAERAPVQLPRYWWSEHDADA